MKLSDCNKCSLSKLQDSGFRRTQVVLGRGSPKYGIMFIGEAPGEEEDKQGYPFVNSQPAGGMFDKILSNLALNRGLVYTTNAVKCRPTQVGDRGPKNRAPSEIEIEECRPWLTMEIRKVKPKLIVVAGGVALKSVLRVDGISRHAGRLIKSKEFGCYIFPILHPAAIVYDETRKSKMKANIVALRTAMREIFR